MIKEFFEKRKAKRASHNIAKICDTLASEVTKLALTIYSNNVYCRIDKIELDVDPEEDKAIPMFYSFDVHLELPSIRPTIKCVNMSIYWDLSTSVSIKQLAAMIFEAADSEQGSNYTSNIEVSSYTPVSEDDVEEEDDK